MKQAAREKGMEDRRATSKRDREKEKNKIEA